MNSKKGPRKREWENLKARSTKDTNGRPSPRNMFVEIIEESPRLLKGKKPLNVNEVTSMAKINGSPRGSITR